MEATGNTLTVADSMGHADLQSMKPYQHALLGTVRDAINRRNQETGSRHVLRHAGDFGSIEVVAKLLKNNAESWQSPVECT